MSNDTLATVNLWGTEIGVVLWSSKRQLGIFEYSPGFMDIPVELSPITMPKQKGPISFASLNKETFYGLPGMVADCLPDKFGNLLIDQWCSLQGRDSLNPVERLLYVGDRSMGALEFSPSINKQSSDGETLHLDSLVKLANDALNEKEQLNTVLEPGPHGNDESRLKAMADILVVGTSAGGARAKAVIAWNKKTNEIRSGQLDWGDDFGQYLIKFDGVDKNKDKELVDPMGFGRLERAYFLMAKDSGISMNDCELIEENGRAHFVAKRFDRVNGQKLHMQSLCGLAHYDFNMAGAYSYEQAFDITMRLLKDRAQPALEQLFRRAVFNYMSRNQDDHTKNISYLMDRNGNWSLSPAYDMTCSYNPQGAWTNGHKMTIAGKRGIEANDDITISDLLACAKHANIKPGKAKRVIEQVRSTVDKFEIFADKAKVDEKLINLTLKGIHDRKGLKA